MTVGFTSGAASLADMERVGSDQVLMEMVGLTKGADQSSLGEWLRAQSPETVEAVMTLNRKFVSHILAKAAPGRVLQAGRPTVFFDDTEIEVDGKRFEGARINYEGERALSFQTLWGGPFVDDTGIHPVRHSASTPRRLSGFFSSLRRFPPVTYPAFSPIWAFRARSRWVLLSFAPHSHHKFQSQSSH